MRLLFPIGYSLLPVLPPVDRAVFPSGCGVFAARLASQNSPVGDDIGVRSSHLTVKEPLEVRLAPQYTFLLVVDIQNIQLARALGKSLAPATQQTAQHGRSERVEKERDAMPGGQGKLGSIAANHAHGSHRTPSLAPQGHVLAPDARKCGMKFNPYRGAEAVFGGEKHGAPHARAKIDEGVFVQRRDGPAAPPVHDDGMKHRRRNGIVGRNVTVVPVP